MSISDDLDRRFREAAASLELLDVAYDVVDSEIGPLLAAVTDRGLACLSFDPEPGERLESLAAFAGPRILRTSRRLDLVRHELDEYFAGRRTMFDLSLDLRGLPPFTVSVLAELAKVPYGRTATYRDLAERVGKPSASRAVGTVMNRNRIPIVLPCHRIVGSSGSLVGYAGGLELKERLLRLEGAML
ncbi:MAG: methylated-DNA--[protein]-cysteine S-methyltransferase [Gaiellales bacterium]